jgi:hypothetical protein
VRPGTEPFEGLLRRMNFPPQQCLRFQPLIDGLADCPSTHGDPKPPHNGWSVDRRATPSDRPRGSYFQEGQNVHRRRRAAEGASRRRAARCVTLSRVPPAIFQGKGAPEMQKVQGEAQLFRRASGEAAGRTRLPNRNLDKLGSPALPNPQEGIGDSTH